MASETKPYPLRLPTELIDIAELRATTEHVDKSTAIRQMIYEGAEEYLAKMVCEGRISIGRAAEMLNTPVQEIQRRISACAGPTDEQIAASAKTLNTLKS